MGYDNLTRSCRSSFFTPGAKTPVGAILNNIAAAIQCQGVQVHPGANNADGCHIEQHHSIYLCQHGIGSNAHTHAPQRIPTADRRPGGLQRNAKHTGPDKRTVRSSARDQWCVSSFSSMLVVPLRRFLFFAVCGFRCASCDWLSARYD